MDLQAAPRNSSAPPATAARLTRLAVCHDNGSAIAGIGGHSQLGVAWIPLIGIQQELGKLGRFAQTDR